MLQIRNLEVVYNNAMLVLKGVSISLRQGCVVALLGANGSGKTTLLRAITGILGLRDGVVTKGGITLDGVAIHGLSPTALVRRGITMVPEGRRILAELTVEENLRVGGHTQPASIRAGLDYAYELFPVLAQRRHQAAGYLSGGEQQMLAIGRAMMAAPTYLLLDEPSLGLAPRVVDQIRDLIVTINQAGTAVLLVEQHATMALSVATHGYVLENGAVVLDKPAAALLADDDIRDFYLGGGTEATSLRDIKHYKRRKRWAA